MRRLPESAGVRVVQRPIQAPNAKAYAERFMRSIREECLDRLILFGKRRLRHVVDQFVAHYPGRAEPPGIRERIDRARMWPERLHAPMLSRAARWPTARFPSCGLGTQTEFSDTTRSLRELGPTCQQLGPRSGGIFSATSMTRGSNCLPAFSCIPRRASEIGPPVARGAHPLPRSRGARPPLTRQWRSDRSLPIRPSYSQNPLTQRSPARGYLAEGLPFQARRRYLHAERAAVAPQASCCRNASCAIVSDRERMNERRYWVVCTLHVASICGCTAEPGETLHPRRSRGPSLGSRDLRSTMCRLRACVSFFQSVALLTQSQ